VPRVLDPIYKTEDDYPATFDWIVVDPMAILQHPNSVRIKVTDIMRYRMPVNRFEWTLVVTRHRNQWRQEWKFYFDTYLRDVIWCGPYFPRYDYIEHDEDETPELWAGKRCFKVFDNYWSNGFCIFPKGDYSDKRFKLAEGSKKYNRLMRRVLFPKSRAVVRPVIELMAYYNPELLPSGHPIVEAAFVFNREWKRAYFDARYLDLAHYLLPRPFVCIHAVKAGDDDYIFFLYFPKFFWLDRKKWWRVGYGAVAPLELSKKSLLLMRAMRGDDEGLKSIFHPKIKTLPLISRKRSYKEVERELMIKEYSELVLRGFEPFSLKMTPKKNK